MEGLATLPHHRAPSTSVTGHELAPESDPRRLDPALHSGSSIELTPLPVSQTDHHQPFSKTPLPTYHVRAPSTTWALETDNMPIFTSQTPDAASHLSTLQRRTSESSRQSASGSVATREGRLRSAWSSTSLASLSPASALSSPALNALADLTPLPSPLVMSDSPGPWNRPAQPPRPRGASTSRDDTYSFPFKANASSSPSSSKKQGYHKTRQASGEMAYTSASRLPPGYERNRSISEYKPDAAQHGRPRQVTMGDTASEMDAHTQQLHRERYLAEQRGLVPAKLPDSLPTPPASNASNRSVTDTEEEDTLEDDRIPYIVVQHGPSKTKKFWRPVRQLGQGTFSKVYLATCEKTKAKDPLDEKSLDPSKLIAIKICEYGPAGGADEQRVQLSLKREVEMLQSVSHPSLINLQAFDHENAQALIVLTYCPGGDLFDMASGHRDKLTRSVVQRIFAEMISAVRYLHANLIVHRDIKLENVLLNIPIPDVPLLENPQSHPYAIATLTDLGLSRRIPAPPESPLLTTRCGSEDYAAPEILLGQPYDGRATDAWALGVLLYALMEGRLPFDPPPGKAASRTRAAHRIARCDWQWVIFASSDDEWDEAKGKDWSGARECVEGLLKKVSRGRKSLEDIEKMAWVREGLQVEGGLKSRPQPAITDNESTREGGQR